jgi:hypothetical protein
MRHIPKRNQNDCGVAIAATVARVSYKKARAVTPYDPKDGLSKAALRKMLKELTGQNWKQKALKKPAKLHEFKKADRPIIVNLTNPYKKKEPRGHFVAVYQGKIYDPDRDRAFNRRAKAFDGFRHWQVFHIIVRED